MAMTEASFSVTFKTPKGNLFTIRGDTAEDLKANLDLAPARGLISGIIEIESTLAGQPKAPAASRPAAPAPASEAKPAKPASQDDQQLPPGMGEPACETCGGPTRFDKEGVSQKSGKPYRRYLCSANQLHRATFA